MNNEQLPAKMCTGKKAVIEMALTLAPLAGVAGEDGMDVQLWLL